MLDLLNCGQKIMLSVGKENYAWRKPSLWLQLHYSCLQWCTI